MTLDRFVVVPAAYLYLLRPCLDGAAGTEVLLQRRGDVPFMAGHWAAGAAGHVERGETAVDAVAREALEEIGVTNVELAFLTSMQRTAGGEAIDERVDFFFTARGWAGEPRIMESTKATDLAWFPVSALPEPMVPHEAMVLDLLARGAVPPYLTFGF
jgi:8-oxo-dGTP diphosphatase